MQRSRPRGSGEYVLYLLGVRPAQCDVCGYRTLIYPAGIRHPVQTLERRHDVRLGVQLPVVFTVEGGVGEGVVLELAASGCKLSTTMPCCLGTVLRLQIHLQMEERPLLVERAVVQWTQEATIGVHFALIYTPERERLSHLLRMLQTTHVPAGSLAVGGATAWAAQEIGV